MGNNLKFKREKLARGFDDLSVTRDFTVVPRDRVLVREFDEEPPPCFYFPTRGEDGRPARRSKWNVRRWGFESAASFFETDSPRSRAAACSRGGRGKDVRDCSWCPRGEVQLDKGVFNYHKVQTQKSRFKMSYLECRSRKQTTEKMLRQLTRGQRRTEKPGNSCRRAKRWFSIIFRFDSVVCLKISRDLGQCRSFNARVTTRGRHHP